MNAIIELLGPDAVNRLGWVLVHFLWQGAAVAAALLVILKFGVRWSAQARYVAAYLALLVAAAMPAATWVWLTPSHARATARDADVVATGKAAVTLPPPVVTEADERPRSTDQPPRGRVDDSIPLIVTAWLAGVALLGAYRAGGWVYVQHLRRHGRVPESLSVHRQLDRLRRAMRLRRVVRILHCPRIDSPAVVGVIKPVILLPLACALQLTPAQLEAILAHELAHVRRHDYLLNLIQTAIETLLFFHPAVWWMSRRIRIEREHAADDLALRATRNDRATYAGALAALEELRTSTPPAPALAARGGPLLARVRRVLGAPAHPADRATWWPAAAVAGLALACVILASQRVTDAAPPATQSHRARTVTVKCVDDSGASVSGAEVYIVDWFTGVHPMAITPLGPVITGADGSAEFTRLPTSEEVSGAIYAYARVAGKLAGVGMNATNFQGARPIEEPVRVLMRPVHTLRGQLSVPDGVAADSLTVRIERISSRSREELGQFTPDIPSGELWPELFEHRVASDGTFELRDVPDNIGLSLYARGPGVATKWLHQLPEPQNGYTFRAELVRESVIEGVVEDTEGRDLAGAGSIEVWAVNETPPLDNPDRNPMKARPQADGTFRIAGLNQGVHTISVRNLPDDRAAESFQVRVERGQVLQGISIPLQPGVVVTGTITDAIDGKPLRGATVAVTPDEPWGGGPIRRSDPTGADGRFSIRAPAARMRFYVFQRPKGYGRSEALALDLRPGQPKPPELQFKLGPPVPDPGLRRATAPKGVVRGRVVDEQGKPLAGVIVECRVPGPDGEFWPRMGARTKDDGRYHFTFLEAGVAHKVTIPEWNTSPAESDELTVEANSTLDMPDLQVTRRDATGEVRGVVVDQEGSPIAKAWVRINNIESTQTDNDGRFRFQVYDAAPQHSVSVDAASYVAKAVHVEPGEVARITMEPVQPGERNR